MSAAALHVMLLGEIGRLELSGLEGRVRPGVAEHARTRPVGVRVDVQPEGRDVMLGEERTARERRGRHRNDGKDVVLLDERPGLGGVHRRVRLVVELVGEVDPASVDAAVVVDPVEVGLCPGDRWREVRGQWPGDRREPTDDDSVRIDALGVPRRRDARRGVSARREHGPGERECDASRDAGSSPHDTHRLRPLRREASSLQ